MASAIVCMGCSAVYHLFCCINQPVALALQRLDFAGISVLIGTPRACRRRGRLTCRCAAGSTFPPIYYWFYCNFDLATAYLSLVVIINSMCMAVMLIPRFRSACSRAASRTAASLHLTANRVRVAPSRPEYRVHRVVSFIGSGFAGLGPILHVMVRHGFASEEVMVCFWYLILMGVLYVGGSIIYAARIPERFAPGTFDMVVRRPLLARDRAHAAPHASCPSSLATRSGTCSSLQRPSPTTWECWRTTDGAKPPPAPSSCCPPGAPPCAPVWRRGRQSVQATGWRGACKPPVAPRM